MVVGCAGIRPAPLKTLVARGWKMVCGLGGGLHGLRLDCRLSEGGLQQFCFLGGGEAAHKSSETLF